MQDWKEKRIKAFEDYLWEQYCNLKDSYSKAINKEDKYCLNLQLEVMEDVLNEMVNAGLTEDVSNDVECKLYNLKDL